MSPRPYRAGKRRLAATEATRRKIVQAARELLADRNGPAFSIDAIAERADVARMTVYYQFKSKGKLLEALFDDFAERAEMRNMRKVFEESDPVKAFGILIGVFCNLWETQAPIVRRLSALAALDPEVDAALIARGSWRREAIARLVKTLPPRTSEKQLVEVLHVITSFGTYDMLAEQQMSGKKIAAVLQRTAATLLEHF